MKFWWVLAWDSYYPGAGLENVKAKCPSEEEARHRARDIELTGVWDYVRVVNVIEESCRE